MTTWNAQPTAPDTGYSDESSGEGQPTQPQPLIRIRCGEGSWSLQSFFKTNAPARQPAERGDLLANSRLKCQNLIILNEITQAIQLEAIIWNLMPGVNQWIINFWQN